MGGGRESERDLDAGGRRNMSREGYCLTFISLAMPSPVRCGLGNELRARHGGRCIAERSNHIGKCERNGDISLPATAL